MVTLVIHSVFCFSVELEEMAQKKKTNKTTKKTRTMPQHNNDKLLFKKQL